MPAEGSASSPLHDVDVDEDQDEVVDLPDQFPEDLPASQQPRQGYASFAEANGLLNWLLTFSSRYVFEFIRSGKANVG